MNRRNMILTLASAALLPSTRLLAGSPFPDLPGQPGQGDKDRKLARFLIATEYRSWAAFQNFDAKTWSAISSDDFFEILGGGAWLATKAELLADVETKAWETLSYALSEITVIQPNETSALVRYRILADYIHHYADASGAPIAEPVLTHAIAMSCYAKIKGRWLGSSYQETDWDASAHEET